MTATITSATRTAAGQASAAAAVASPPGFADDGGRSPTVGFGAAVAETGDRAGVLATRPAGDATVQDLLRLRANLPAGHPDRAGLRTRSIEAGLPLARCLAARYRGRGEPLDDLYQVAALALVKAVDGYDAARQAAFTSYAVPTIVGELKRHFRDTTWRVRVPRRIQDLAITLAPTHARLAQQLGRPPTRQELAAHLDTTEDDIATARSAWQAHHPDSLDALSAAGGAEQRPLIETIGGLDQRLDTVTDRHTLQQLLAGLPRREQHILAMRYFADMTQAEIAGQVGMSQMHVSRLLVRTLTQLRARMQAERTSHPPHRDPAQPAARRA
ncbi:MAG TPA: SigB/SigF/SigG family RNA polymerase sigma factor [Micromonosporaceae bacterium]|nr:SigB/SigF/SigG family RNA polymerase sigma factor [Micromonosporaceae bacterium]